MSQKLPLGDLIWVEETSPFNENFIKKCNEVSDEGFFLEVDVQYPKNLSSLYNDCMFFHVTYAFQSESTLFA